MGKLVKGKKESEKNISGIVEKDKVQEEVIFQEKPQICLIDIEDKIKENLTKKGLNVESGTLGKAIKVSNEDNYNSNSHKCLSNLSFPPNLHEYEIIVLDLENKEVIPYNVGHHSKKYIQGFSDGFFLSQYPENLFDPRPYGSYVLRCEIAKNNGHQFILIIFASAYVKKEYQFATYTSSGTHLEEVQTYYNYDFCSKIPYATNKFGRELVIQKESDLLNLHDFLNKYSEGATYHIFFSNPDINKETEVFLPLIKNSHGEIVSFFRFFDNCLLFVFPQIVEKSSFLEELLTNQLPTLWPNLFPFNSKFKWLEQEAYMLPNVEHLLEEKESLIKRFDAEIEQKEKEIEANYKKYECLHRLLTESGDELVKSVKAFLEWLGFKKIRIMDDASEGLLEEDLQVDTEDGLLVIEIKGIGGTSTDGQCSQIEKIKNRRMQERQNFDVFGLYIVNHQRYQPPLLRENPPFKREQIQDAESDKRGLLTTWQLFNLYFSIKNGCISKEEARKALLKYGLIEFSPQNCVSLDEPVKILHNGKVILLDLSPKMKTNDELIIKREHRYIKTQILGIQVNDKKVEFVESGPVGIELKVPVKKSDELFLKSNNSLDAS